MAKAAVVTNNVGIVGMLSWTTNLLWLLAQAPAAAPAAAPAVAAPTAAYQPRMVGGFRMEGAPEVEVVFGDTAAYRARIDRFFTLNTEMAKHRREVSKRVQASLAVLVQHKRGCPTEDVAPHYAAAHMAAEEYRRLGIALEIESSAIETLDRFGESQGLTPDYRWKVNKVPETYKATLADYREMQVALSGQLDKDLTYRGCQISTLLNVGRDSKALPPLAYSVPVPPPRRNWRNPEPEPVVPASTVTFFIDNRSCDEALEVFSDGVLLGEVGARKRVAFQALAGNHAICLIGKGDSRQCGDAETVRTAYVHDGWAMTLHCRPSKK